MGAWIEVETKFDGRGEPVRMTILVQVVLLGWDPVVSHVYHHEPW